MAIVDVVTADLGDRQGNMRLGRCSGALIGTCHYGTTAIGVRAAASVATRSPYDGSTAIGNESAAHSGTAVGSRAKATAAIAIGNNIEAACGSVVLDATQTCSSCSYTSGGIHLHSRDVGIDITFCNGGREVAIRLGPYTVTLTDQQFLDIFRNAANA